MPKALFLPFCLVALFASGCGGERDALRKEVDALRQELGRVHAMNATLASRVDTLELSREAKTNAPAAEAKATRDDDRPSLDVVHLKPTAEGKPQPLNEPQEIQEIDAARPVLRSAGGGVVVAQNGSPKMMKQAAAKGTDR